MKTLTEQDYKDAAIMLQCDVPAVKAVAQVESQGDGFLSDGSPKILFEGHVFWRELKKKGITPQLRVHGNENILYKDWTRKYYKGGIGEYDRLKKACEINEEAALRSASWGAFQIMGNHAEELGFSDVFDFVYSIRSGARANLMAFVNYVRHFKLDGHLRNHVWDKFARGYNGPV